MYQEEPIAFSHYSVCVDMVVPLAILRKAFPHYGHIEYPQLSDAEFWQLLDHCLLKKVTVYEESTTHGGESVYVLLFTQTVKDKIEATGFPSVAPIPTPFRCKVEHFTVRLSFLTERMTPSLWEFKPKLYSRENRAFQVEFEDAIVDMLNDIEASIDALMATTATTVKV